MSLFSDHARLSFVCIMLCSAALQGCHSIGHRLVCSDSTKSSTVSPDHSNLAETVQSDCGATEHDTVVRLRRNRVFASAPEDVFVVSGSHDLKVSWRGNRQLNVNSPTCASQSVQSKNWRDVVVQCESSNAAAVSSR
jgi:hypothetical protein